LIDEIKAISLLLLFIVVTMQPCSQDVWEMLIDTLFYLAFNAAGGSVLVLLLIPAP
jgi:hypothetical protein